MNTLYVNANASGANNGISWTDAFTILPDALAIAGSCANIKQVWVAKGTYKPTPTLDRTISFHLLNNVAIYGGFAGTETAINQRDYKNNLTILSGDLKGDDHFTFDYASSLYGNNYENSKQVIANGTGIDHTAVPDGFQVSECTQ